MAHLGGRINNPVLQERKWKPKVLQLVHAAARREARKSGYSQGTSPLHRHCAILEMGMEVQVCNPLSAVLKSKTPNQKFLPDFGIKTQPEVK